MGLGIAVAFGVRLMLVLLAAAAMILAGLFVEVVMSGAILAGVVHRAAAFVLSGTIGAEPAVPMLVQFEDGPRPNSPCRFP